MCCPRRFGSLAFVAGAVALQIPSPAVAAPSAGPFVDRLHAVRSDIRSLECVEETHWRDERPGQTPVEHRRIERVSFRSDISKVRREALDEHGSPLPIAAPGSSRTATGYAVARVQRHPSPVWLFELAETLARAGTAWRREGGLSVAALHFGGRTSVRDPPSAEVAFNADRLPIRLVTFGASHDILDEVHLTWGRQRGGWFPSKIETTYHSVENTLHKTVTYRDTRINPVLSATLFRTP